MHSSPDIITKLLPLATIVTTASLTPTASTSRSLCCIQAKILKSLLEYVLFHFLAEEVLQRRVAYPQYRQHRAIHQAFTSQCLDVQRRFNDSTLDIDGALLGSLYQWCQFFPLSSTC